MRFDPAKKGGPVDVWHKGKKVQQSKPVNAYANCFVKRRARKGKGRLRRARAGRAAGDHVRASRSLRDLTLAPEALTLDVLDTALAAAQNALAVVHPDRDALSEVYGCRLPPPSVLLAALLLDRLREVRELLGWYRATYRADGDTCNDDYPF